MRSQIQIPSIVNHHAHSSSSSRRQTRSCLHRNNYPLHLRPCPCQHLTLRSADGRLLRLLPSHPPLLPVHLQSLLSDRRRPVAPSARRVPHPPLLPSLLVRK